MASFPTVLVVTADGELRQTLLRRLEEKRCLVLQANDEDAAFRVTLVHSRPIHILLVDVSVDRFGTLAERLEPYRARNASRVCPGDMEGLMGRAIP